MAFVVDLAGRVVLGDERKFVHEKLKCLSSAGKKDRPKHVHQIHRQLRAGGHWSRRMSARKLRARPCASAILDKSSTRFCK
jgi:hypothetical protein